MARRQRHKVAAKKTAKGSALQALDIVKRITKEKKEEKPLSLSSFPFPELAKSINSETQTSLISAQESPQGKSVKKKGIKKGKKFVTSADFMEIINKVNEQEEATIKKKQLKQDKILEKEIQKQNNRIQRKMKNEAKIQRGKELIRQHKEPQTSSNKKTGATKKRPTKTK